MPRERTSRGHDGGRVIPRPDALKRRDPSPRRIVSVLAVLAVMVLAGCTLGRERAALPPEIPSASIPVTTPSTEGLLHLFVQPEAGRAPILDEIAAARRSVTLHVYLLSDDATIAALEAAAARGVAVRVLLEEQPFGGAGDVEEVFRRLQEGGIDVRWGNPAFRFSHVKAMVVDGEAAVIMNQNLTRAAFEQNRELNVLTTRPAEVAQVAALFEADWRRGGEPPPGPLVVSPTTSRRVLRSLIDGATRSLDLYAEVVRDPEMIAALSAAADRGVRVRLVMSGEAGDDQADERAALAAAGVEVRLVSSPYIHAKLILADGALAFVGSQNLTATSLDQNREVGILLDDATALRRIARTFDQDFGSAAPMVPT